MMEKDQDDTAIRETQLTVCAAEIRSLSLLEPIRLAKLSSQDTRGEDGNKRNDAPHGK